MNIEPLFDDGYLKTADFSTDRLYRYRLTRRWDETKPFMGVVGLNPSTADEKLDDPTIRRCINFAKSWGYGGLLMGNIFAFRSTDPKGLLGTQDPVGAENDAWLQKIKSESELVLAAWGTHGKLMGRGDYVKKLLPGLHALGLNEDGSPRHPLYLPKGLKPVPFG